jgi:PAS domain S-box-containing protein
MKLRSYLIALIVATLLPVLIFIATMVLVFRGQQQTAVQRGLLDTARALSSAVDRELLASIRTLEALATSEFLDSGDLHRFHAQASRAQKAHEAWQSIVMVEPSSQQLVNTRFPFGAPLPHSALPKLVNEVGRTGKSAVSDLFTGAILKKPLLAVGVPVVREGKVKYILISSMSPVFLAQLLAQGNLTPSWLATVIDRNKIIIARTQQLEKFLGKPVAPAFAANATKTEKVMRHETMPDGVEVYGIDIRSELSGWTVGLAVPVSSATAPVRRSVVIAGTGGLAVGLLGIGLATLFAWRISRPIVALAASAEAIAHGEPVQTVHSSIVEIDDVASALEEAALTRKLAEESLRASDQLLREQYTELEHLYKTTPVGLALMDHDLRFVRINDRLAKINGKPAAEHLGHTLREVVPQIAGELESVYRRVFETGEPVLNVEIHGTTPAASDVERDWLTSFHPLRMDDCTVRGICAVVQDITEQKQTARTLETRYQELQWLHEVSQTILISNDLNKLPATILDKALTVSLCDLGTVRLLDRTTGMIETIASRGYQNPENLLGHRKSPQDLMTRRVYRSVKLNQTAVVERVQEEKGLRTFRKENVQSLLTVPVVADQEIIGLIQIASRTQRKFDPDLVSLIETLGSNLGIAMQKSRLLEEALASQAELRGLSRRLVEAQESERQVIARELHDEIGQVLTGLKLSLALAVRSGASQDNTKLDKAVELVDDLLTRVRDLSLRFRPAMLDDLGLVPTLLWYFKNYTAQTSIEVNFEHTLDRRLALKIETAAYRIVQESLTNVARHSNVDTLKVRCWAFQQFFYLEIKDQGAGFDPSTTKPDTAGLSGMRERVVSLGGHLTVQSAPGAGTRVFAEFPLENGRSDFM